MVFVEVGAIKRRTVARGEYPNVTIPVLVRIRASTANPVSFTVLPPRAVLGVLTLPLNTLRLTVSLPPYRSNSPH
jgi:hypothetical protein